MGSDAIADWFRYWELLASLIKGVAWPITVFMFGFYFRKEIGEAIPRIVKFGAAGVEMSVPKQLKNTPKETLSEEVISDKYLENLKDPVAAELEEKNRQDLNALAPKAQSEREDLLLRALTVQQMMKSFGIAYSGIFGSQIRALHSLNSRPIPRSEAEELLSQLKITTPSLGQFSIDDYMAYLLNWRFVQFVGGKYSITETGREFLKFILDNGLSEERMN